MSKVFEICCLLIVLIGLPVCSAASGGAPVVSSVTPRIIASGEVITIQGRRLSEEGAKTMVKIDGQDVPYLKIDPNNGITVQVNSNPISKSKESAGQYDRTVVVSLNGQDSAPVVFHQLTWQILQSKRVLFPLILYILTALILTFGTGVFRSETGQWSLSKIQMAAWTFVFGLFYVILSAGRKEFLDITQGMFWLMGISATTAAGAKAIVLKNNIGIPLHPSRLLHDWNDNAGGGKGAYVLSLHRAQIFLWSLIVLSIVIVKVMATMRLPEIPNNLLVLMGISGGTYLGFNYPKVEKKP